MTKDLFIDLACGPLPFIDCRNRSMYTIKPEIYILKDDLAIYNMRKQSEK